MEIEGQLQAFCCVGCQAVARAIVDGGLGNFYHYRDRESARADLDRTTYDAYDLEDIQAQFVTPLDDGFGDILIGISGISCAACAWLIEQRLKQFAAIKSVSVNATNYRGRIVWDRSQLRLSEIFQSIADIGYQLYPYCETEQARTRQKDARTAMVRLGIAGLGMMQVGMFAIALHAGALQGMSEVWQHLFRIVSAVVATPVILISARPFFQNALRGLRLKRLNMDVPVSLALILAYGASLYATVTNTGEVYFDSVSMFTFFLLLGRFLEMRTRHSSGFASEGLTQLLPLSVQRNTVSGQERVPITALAVNDQVIVDAGETIPCDGVVITGQSHVDESILTGESQPRMVSRTDEVFAGSSNGEARIVVSARRVSQETRLAAIERITAQAIASKPEMLARVDRLSSGFVLAVVIGAGVVGTYWYVVEPARALWVVLSVLVATCPCALSLATPTVLTAGTLRLRQEGLLVSSPSFIEKLAFTNHVVLDKTGTLTQGKLAFAEYRAISSADASGGRSDTGAMSQDSVLDIVAALEDHSHHPVAYAFKGRHFDEAASQVSVHLGLGVEGMIGGDHFRFGRADFALLGNGTQLHGGIDSVCKHAGLAVPGTGLWQLLVRNGKALAWIRLEDSPRPGVQQLLGYFSSRAVSVEILSGDREQNVAAFAQAHGIENYQAEVRPEDKLARVAQLQSSGVSELMMGDGINDVPVLAGAKMSIAMGGATKLAQTNADAILVGERLDIVATAIEIARRVRAIIHQNMAWALLYNLAVLPVAAMGWLPPYIAAIGMSLSSFVVVLNALRIQSSQVLPMEALTGSKTDGVQPAVDNNVPAR